jgi:hypothetical protein
MPPTWPIAPPVMASSLQPTDTVIEQSTNVPAISALIP